MMNNPQVIVALNNISKISDGKRILTNLDLETHDGESLSLQHTSSGGTRPLLRRDQAPDGADLCPLGHQAASKGGKLYLQAPMTTEAASRKHQLNVPARTAPDSG